MKRLVAIGSLVLAMGIGGHLYAQSHFQGCHVNTATVTVCRVGPGVFYAVTINTKGAAGNYTYIWDAAAGPAAAAVPIVKLDTTAGPLTLTYNMMVTTGVVVWNTSGTISDLTVLVE